MSGRTFSPPDSTTLSIYGRVCLPSWRCAKRPKILRGFLKKTIARWILVIYIWRTFGRNEDKTASFERRFRSWLRLKRRLAVANPGLPGLMWSIHYSALTWARIPSPFCFITAPSKSLLGFVLSEVGTLLWLGVVICYREVGNISKIVIGIFSNNRIFWKQSKRQSWRARFALIFKTGWCI